MQLFSIHYWYMHFLSVYVHFASHDVIDTIHNFSSITVYFFYILYILVLIIFHVNITLHKFLIIDTCIYIHISLITFHDVIITVHD